MTLIITTLSIMTLGIKTQNARALSITKHITTVSLMGSIESSLHFFTVMTRDFILGVLMLSVIMLSTVALPNSTWYVW